MKKLIVLSICCCALYLCLLAKVGGVLTRLEHEVESLQEKAALEQSTRMHKVNTSIEKLLQRDHECGETVVLDQFATGKGVLER